MTAKKAKPHLPYLPPAYTQAEIAAIKALSKGEADSDQQLLALKWILQDACGRLDFHYYATDRDTAFALGRVFVAQQIAKLINYDPKLMTRDASDNLPT